MAAFEVLGYGARYYNVIFVIDWCLKNNNIMTFQTTLLKGISNTTYDLDIAQCFHRWSLHNQHGRHIGIPTGCIPLIGT